MNNNRNVKELILLRERAVNFVKELGEEFVGTNWKSKKKLYRKLKKDDESVLFGEETLNNNWFRKLKRSKYIKDKAFVNLIIKLENIDNIFEKDVVATKTTFVEKKFKWRDQHYIVSTFPFNCCMPM